MRKSSRKSSYDPNLLRQVQTLWPQQALRPGLLESDSCSKLSVQVWRKVFTLNLKGFEAYGGLQCCNAGMLSNSSVA